MTRPWYQALTLWLLAIVSSFGIACGTKDADPEFSYTTITGVRCLEGTVACGADCVRVESSSAHCGSCDEACSSEEVCDLGRCKPRLEGCSSPRLLCGSDCVDSLEDREHCGACGEVCPAEGTCEAGGCACPGELTVCGEACVDTASDPQNCGGCDQRCVDTQTCEAGSCQCPLGGELCARTSIAVADNAVTLGAQEAACVDTSADSQNCGGCGNVCSGGQVCAAGSCECPDGGTLCTDVCVDASSDIDNCGGCGNVCSGGQICSQGSCECPDGQSLCDGQCFDTQSDADHCGSCDTACGLGLGCVVGSCESGALGDDGCQGLVSGLSISQIAVYQTVESVIARDGQAIAQPEPDVVAARPTLVRVFVAPQPEWTQREVSARLFLAKGIEEATLYSTTTLSPVAASEPEDRASTFEFSVPAADVTPDTQFAVELVECNDAAPGTVSDARYPASEAADLGAIDSGGLRLHLVPLRANGRLPDTSDAALGLYQALFLDSYPIGTLDLTVSEPLDIDDPEDWNRNLDSIRALRQREGPPADVYYYGLNAPTETFDEFCNGGCVAGIGYIPPNGFQAPQARVAMGLAYADITSAFIMLHEVGHNHGRQHAPCVPLGAQISDVDPDYPDNDGSIGTIGYNALGDQLIGPDATDVMGYCDGQWFSAYTYSGLLDRILQLNQRQASQVVEAERIGAWEVLLADAAHGLRWGEPSPGPVVAMGEGEPAVVLDAAGAPMEDVTVYRTRLSDTDASSIEVPQRRAGWSAIQLTGEAPIAFPSGR